MMLCYHLICWCRRRRVNNTCLFFHWLVTCLFLQHLVGAFSSDGSASSFLKAATSSAESSILVLIFGGQHWDAVAQFSKSLANKVFWLCLPPLLAPFTWTQNVIEIVVGLLDFESPTCRVGYNFLQADDRVHLFLALSTQGIDVVFRRRHQYPLCEWGLLISMVQVGGN